MRPLKYLSLGVVAVTLAACDKDEITTPSRPALAGVRFINALTDVGFNVDIRMIDQVEWSAVGNDVAFRAGTEHQPTEAGARRIRVFPTSKNLDTASKILLDTTVTIEAGKNITLMLAGSRVGNTERFVLIDDTPPACNNDVAVRAINAGAAAAADVFFMRKSTDTRPATPGISNVAPLTASAYISRTPDSTFVSTFKTGSTASADAYGTATGTIAAAPLAGQRPAAGVNVACTAYSIVTFPARNWSTAQGGQTGALAAPATVLFLDRVP